jgi:copper resistance protein B
MKHACTVLLALGLSVPAYAQHDGHVAPDSRISDSSDPHAGHAMGHGVPAAGAAPAVAPPPAEALMGPSHSADTVFPAAVMAQIRRDISAEHGGMTVQRITIDQLEFVSRDGGDGYAWEDAQFRIGSDSNKLWLKSEGEADGGFGQNVERFEVQALWSHALTPYFDLQGGVRYDHRPEPDRAHVVLGLQGLAPYWFEVDAVAFVSERGDLTARVETEYDLRITQKLILQPRAEAGFAAQAVRELEVGSGLSTVEAGLRLRYEFVPEFAVYAGVEYELAAGDTADFRRAAGNGASAWSVVLGVRCWR